MGGVGLFPLRAGRQDGASAYVSCLRRPDPSVLHTPPPIPPAPKPANETKLFCTDKWPASAKVKNATYVSLRMEYTQNKGESKCKVRSTLLTAACSPC